MPLTVWTQNTGYSFGILQEQVTVNLDLPVANDTGVTYTVISGALPGGLVLSGNQIVGTPYIVSNVVDYTFCIRASNGTDFADRTFTVSINGNNPPEWVTPAGSLAIGVNEQLYVLDSTYASYQLEAFDLNEALGSTLTYFIASGDGALPPGLELSNSGLISGYVKPALTITPEDGSGTFDETFYDDVAYDFANLPTDGFDSYQYDDVFFDFNQPTTVPNSLNANYQFRVTVTDGTNFSQRVFKIFVVGTDEFRADSTSLDGFAGNFTADSSFLRRPVWLTNANLGLYRANNYITVPVALYDNTNTEFRLEATNQEVYAVTQQIGNSDNIANGTTVTVSNVTGTPIAGQYFTFDNYITGATGAIYHITNVASLGNSEYRLTIATPLLITVPNGFPFYIGSLSELPPGTNFDVNTGEIYGLVPYQPQVTQTYNFTITATRFGLKTTEVVNSSKLFSIKILGDVSGVITWNTDPDLGTIAANYVCTLSINATSDVPNAIVQYAVTDGSLPPELILSNDGELIGTTPQYGDSIVYRSLWQATPSRPYAINDVVTHNGNLYICTVANNAGTFSLSQWKSYAFVNYGLTTFQDTDNYGVTYTTQTFDKGSSTIDRSYTFTVTASDQYGYDSTSRTFTIKIITPNTVPYSNITTRPFLAPTQRNSWKSFINDTSVFTPGSIYRPNDSNFGVQKDLTMMVYAGIQTEAAAAYVGAMGLGFKRKRFQFGGVKTAMATDPNTGKEVYEVVYIQMVDPQEQNGLHLPTKITVQSLEPETITVDDSNGIWANDNTTLSIDAPTAIRPDYAITVDSTGYEVSNPNTNTYYPSSISNWQTRLSAVGLTERNYLPLWMRTIQTGTKQQLGYMLAVPLCYCKPGTAAAILKNIEFNGFEFNMLDYTVDRFTITAVTGYASDKYLVFRNDRITV